MFKEQQFPVSSTSKLWGVLYLPDDHDSNPELCPLIVFNHGKGEAGSSQTNLPLLYLNGPLTFAKQGNKMEFINPITAKKQRFMILALQHPNWSPDPSQIAYCLENDIFKNYKVDRKCVVVTGLSAGGDATLKCITASMAAYFCAAVPMSPASTGGTDLSITKSQNIRTWGFSGDQDSTFTDNLKSWDAKLNAVLPGNARSFIYAGAHGGWNAFYDPAYKSKIWGPEINIYEFFLACTAGLNWQPAAPPSTVVKAVISAPTDGQTINVNSLAVDGSNSQAVRSDWEGYKWVLTPVEGGNWGAGFEKTATDGGGIYGPAKRKIINLTDGKYQLSLTVMDSKRVTNTQVVIFNVKIGATIPEPTPTPQPPPTPTPEPTPTPTPTKSLVSVSTKVDSGKLVAELNYSDGTKQIVS